MAYADSRELVPFPERVGRQMPPFLERKSEAGDSLKEYRTRRTLARIGILILLASLFVLVYVSEPASAWINRLPSRLQATVVMALIGALTIVVAGTVLQWASWECPMCRKKFVWAVSTGSLLTFPIVCLRLIGGTRCASCFRRLE